MILYSYWRSTTSYRVRIALNMIGLDYEIRPIDLVAGDQRAPLYVALKPCQGVPTLVLEDGRVLTQSMAILDYLAGQHPQTGLLPTEAIERARILAAAHTIALDIHPVNNLRVVAKLKQMGHSQAETTGWMHHWMSEGFRAYLALIRDDTTFSFGDTPTLADICLTAQMYNAHRWGLDLTPFKRLQRIEQNCLAIDAIDRARPENQPDAEKE